MKTIFPFCILLASVAASFGQNGGTNLTIIVPPQSQTVSNGGTAVFSVTATGSGPLSYTWLFNGTNLPTPITSVAGVGNGGGCCVGTYSGDGGPATSAGLNNPIDVAMDGAGDFFIADLYNGRIRKVDTNSIITTVAGNGGNGYSGDGGAATNANLWYASGVAVDNFDTLLSLTSTITGFAR